MTQKTEWKDIPEFEGLFQVSKCARFRRLPRRTASSSLGLKELKTFRKSSKSDQLYAKVVYNGKVRWFAMDKLIRKLWPETDKKVSLGNNITCKRGRYQVYAYNYGKKVWVGSYTTHEKAMEEKFKYEMEKWAFHSACS